MSPVPPRGDSGKLPDSHCRFESLWLRASAILPPTVSVRCWPRSVDLAILFSGSGFSLGLSFRKFGDVCKDFCYGYVGWIEAASYQCLSSACSEWSGSAMTMRKCSNPGSPPTSSGGARRAPSMKHGYARAGSTDMSGPVVMSSNENHGRAASSSTRNRQFGSSTRHFWRHQCLAASFGRVVSCKMSVISTLTRQSAGGCRFNYDGRASNPAILPHEAVNLPQFS